MSPERLDEIRVLYFKASVRMSPERSFALLIAVRDLLEAHDRVILNQTEEHR